MAKGCHQFEDIKILDNLSTGEKIFTSVLKFFAYSISYFENVTGLTTHGLSIKKNANRQQTTTSTVNGVTIYRRKEYSGASTNQFRGMDTINKLLIFHIKKFPNKEFLGYRPILREIGLNDDPKKRQMKLVLGEYKWLTCHDVLERIVAIRSVLSSIGVRKGTKIVIFAETSQDWLMTAFAIMLLRATIVTVYPTLSDEYIINCILLTEPVAILVDPKTAQRVKGMLKHLPTIKTILFTTRCPSNYVTIFSDYTIDPFHLETVYDEARPISDDISFEESDPQDLVIIMFTSGSTGRPKGVMVNHSNLIAMLAGVESQRSFWTEQTYPGYLPLSHILEICCELAMLFYNGRVGYCNPTTLFDNGPMLAENSISDLRALKPTCLGTVPLILERIHKGIKNELSKVSRTKKLMFQTLYNIKAHFYSRGYNTYFLDKLVFGKFRQIFGGKIRFCIVGGACISRETEEFFNVVLGAFKQAYGTTEICCGATMSNLDYVPPMNVGPPFGCSELRVIPWEEGGYTMNDGKGVRGEVLVSGPSVCSGYYMNEELTKQYFVEDPVTKKIWYHTSDIVELLDDGTFRIIGRTSDIIKLNHGEFVELQKIENVISSSKYVDFVCCTSSSDQDHIIAVICLNYDNIMNLAISTSQVKSPQVSFESAVHDINIREIITADIETCTNRAKLSKFELPKNLIFVEDLWTPESDLLTPSMKIKRVKILNKYKKLIEDI